MENDFNVHEMFDNVLTVVTKPIKRGHSTVIDWPFKGLTADLIEDTKGNCGCTKPEVLNDRVRAIYTDSSDIKEVKKQGAIVVSKSVTVYLKDGKPLKVPNPKTGEEDWNPEKTSIALTFHVSVVP